MRIMLPLIIVAIVAAGTPPAAAQQVVQATAAQHAELSGSVGNPARRGWRGRAKRSKFRHASGLRGNDLCSIVNGWRSFAVRTRYSFFNTGRIRCTH